MSVQHLGAKKVRKLERETGQTILFAVANGGYLYEFVTPDDRHGLYDLKTGEWWWGAGRHFTSCSRLNT